MGVVRYKPKQENIIKLKKYINDKLGKDNKQHRLRNNI